MGARPRELSDPVSWDDQWKGRIGTHGSNLYKGEDGKALWHGGRFEGYFGEGLYWGPIPHATENTGDWVLSEFGGSFLDKDHEQPFFLACGFFRPHSPQLAPQKFFDMYPIDDVVVPDAPEWDMDDVPENRRRNGFSPVVEYIRELGEMKKAVQACLASVSYVDACIGNLLEGLENSQYPKEYHNLADNLAYADVKAKLAAFLESKGL